MNSISESINGVITICLRIYRGKNIKKIKKIIEKRINNFNNRNLNNVPIEVIRKRNPLNPRIHIQPTRQNNIKDKTTNKNYEYKIGDKVWLKNFIAPKLTKQ